MRPKLEALLSRRKQTLAYFSDWSQVPRLPTAQIKAINGIQYTVHVKARHKFLPSPVVFVKGFMQNNRP